MADAWGAMTEACSAMDGDVEVLTDLATSMTAELEEPPLQTLAEPSDDDTLASNPDTPSPSPVRAVPPKPTRATPPPRASGSVAEDDATPRASGSSAAYDAPRSKRTGYSAVEQRRRLERSMGS